MNTIKIIFNQFPFFFALKLILKKSINKLFERDTKTYYSQTGEDIIIKSLLENHKGFYIDVGCNDPIQYSNTFELYIKGWTGLNIDANPSLINKYKIRPNDISVCEAVSDQAKEMIFHEFEQCEVSTLDDSVLSDWKDNWNYKSNRKVTTKTLTQIIEENGIKNEIDFLSIDVEGHDFQVLKSLDYNKYSPKLILIEMHQFSINDYKSNEIVSFLDQKGYDLVGFVIMNGYFVRRK